MKLGPQQSEPLHINEVLAPGKAKVDPVVMVQQVATPASAREMELAIKRERITDSVTKRRTAGQNLGPQQIFTPSQIQNARRLINAGESTTQVAKDLHLSRATLYRRIATLES